jgi:hypothetical protein
MWRNQRVGRGSNSGHQRYSPRRVNYGESTGPPKTSTSIVFLTNDFDHESNVCGRLWFIRDLSTLEAPSMFIQAYHSEIHLPLSTSGTIRYRSTRSAVRYRNTDSAVRDLNVDITENKALLLFMTENFNPDCVVRP